MEAAQRSTEYLGEMITPPWPAVELIEAAARSGRGEVAADALRRLAEITSASGTDWALGIEARSRALLSDGDTAERWYRESIERLGRTCIRAELARAHLLYGEWLRRSAAASMPGTASHRPRHAREDGNGGLRGAGQP